MKRPFYYCSECKKILPELDDLLFIDENSNKGFCSEDCIEDFYFPFIKYYEMVEGTLRAKYHDTTYEMASADVIDEVLLRPNEIFKQTNELQDTFYHFIKHFPDFSVVVVTSVYRQEASFVFLSLMTSKKELLNEFRYGEKVSEWGVLDLSVSKAQASVSKYEDEGDLPIDEEDEDEDMVFIQLLESKKSKLLADLLMKRKESDISFEDYSGYESCFQETLDFPDEVFERKDNEGDVIFSYIKSFSNFFYIVTCLKRNDGKENVSVYPILALPTTDVEMCQEFRGGIKLSGPLKN